MKKLFLFSLAFILTVPAMSQTKTPLPAPHKTGGMPLMEALSKRSTNRSLDPAKSLTQQQLSDLLWAAWGINRPDGRRTAPSAMNRQGIDLYLVGRKAVYHYDAQDHSLVLVAEGDFRSTVNSQDYMKGADYSIIFVAEAGTPEVDAGYISQNIYLYCASAGLAGVTHSTLNRPELAQLLKLPDSKRVILGHTVGCPAK